MRLFRGGGEHLLAQRLQLLVEGRAERRARAGLCEADEADGEAAGGADVQQVRAALVLQAPRRANAREPCRCGGFFLQNKLRKS